MKRWMGLSLLLIFLLSACGPSEADIQATGTQVAAELYGTQTALAPTITPTITPTPTETLTPTPTFTLTNTPHPPTATLTEAGVEKLMLCYKAAVSLQADWEVHLLISGRMGWEWYNPDNEWKSIDKISQELNAFWWERSHRAGGIKIKWVNLINVTDKSHGNITLIVDGVELQEYRWERSDCDQYLKEIWLSDTKLLIDPWGGGMKRISEVSFAYKTINQVVKKMRTELLEIYGIDPAELEAIETPIWQFMRNHYGEPLSKNRFWE
ncbi:MAG: hypothetical protein WBB69_00820 [Anaerolineales bacterium]